MVSSNKVSSKNKPEKKATSSASPKEKPISTKKSSEIDDIFSALATAKKEKQQSTATTQVTEISTKKKIQPKIDHDDGFADSRGSNSRRKTDDGYAIYSVQELNIGKGGDTEDCPFDCECCY